MNREQEIYKVTLMGSLGNFVLLIFKFVAAVIGHSSAMMADAVHSLSDFVTDIVVLVFVRISSKPRQCPQPRHNHRATAERALRTIDAHQHPHGTN